MSYSELTRRYFESASHAGVLSGDDVGTHGGVFRGSAGNRERGTWVQFDIQVAEGRCVDARFLAFGCPHTIAVAAWVAEQAIGRPPGASLHEPVASLAERFGVPTEKRGRLLIVEDAWRAAGRAAVG
jgi:hypothetical protein